MNEPVVALVVAAGSGSRLGAAVPKALLPIAGRPLVAHSVAALAAGGCTSAVVVVAADLLDDFRAALADAPIPVDLVVGGAMRQQSVDNGLRAIAAEDGIVLVHDAARPFVPPEVVRQVLESVRAGADCVIPAVPVVDTIRRVRGDGSEVVDRAQLRAVQTPQGFGLAKLRAAHAEAASHGVEYTDDAAVIEASGGRVELVPGSREAMKVTEPFDIAVAEAIARSRGE